MIVELEPQASVVQEPVDNCYKAKRRRDQLDRNSKWLVQKEIMNITGPVVVMEFIKQYDTFGPKSKLFGAQNVGMHLYGSFDNFGDISSTCFCFNY